MKLLAILVGIVACGPPRIPQKPAKPEAPALDVEDAWIDPGDELPKGTRRGRGDKHAALVDAAAPTMVIEGATILTATGPAIADGTIVLVGGAIRAVGPRGSVEV